MRRHLQLQRKVPVTRCSTPEGRDDVSDSLSVCLSRCTWKAFHKRSAQWHSYQRSSTPSSLIPICLRVNLSLIYCSLLALSTNGNCAFIYLFIYRLRDIVFKELTSGQHFCLWYCILRTPSGCSEICIGRSVHGVTFLLRLLTLPDYLDVYTICGKSGLYRVFVCLFVCLFVDRSVTLSACPLAS